MSILDDINTLKAQNGEQPLGNEWDNPIVLRNMAVPDAQKKNSILDDIAFLKQEGKLSDNESKANPARGGIAGGLIQGARDFVNGGGQLLYHALPSNLQKSSDSLDHWLYGKTGGYVGTPDGVTLDQDIANQNNQYEQDRAAAGRSGFDFARLGGNLAASAPLAAVLPGGAIASGSSKAKALADALMYGAKTGAITAAFNPVENGTDDFEAAKLKQIGLGAAGGAAGNVLAKALTSGVKSIGSGAAELLRDNGVNLTLGQNFGGAIKSLEDKLTSVPGLGYLIKNSQERANESLNRAAINKSLAPISTELPKGMNGREAIDFGAKAISNVYDTAIDNIGAVKPDAQFAQDVAGLKTILQNTHPDVQKQFDTILDNEFNKRVDKNGIITAQEWKGADSNLGDLARGYQSSDDYDRRLLSQALTELKNSSRNMIERVAPPNEVGNIKNANKAYAMFLRPQRAASYIGADEGNFTAAQLQNAVKALDESKHDKAFATGKALMQDLSEPAKSVMTGNIPNSGTADRQSVLKVLGTALAGYGAAQDPVALATGGVVGSIAALPYTKIGQKLVNGAFNKKNALADALSRYGINSAALGSDLAQQK